MVGDTGIEPVTPTMSNKDKLYLNKLYQLLNFCVL